MQVMGRLGSYPVYLVGLQRGRLGLVVSLPQGFTYLWIFPECLSTDPLSVLPG